VVLMAFGFSQDPSVFAWGRQLRHDAEEKACGVESGEQ